MPLVLVQKKTTRHNLWPHLSISQILLTYPAELKLLTRVNYLGLRLRELKKFEHQIVKKFYVTLGRNSAAHA